LEVVRRGGARARERRRECESVASNEKGASLAILGGTGKEGRGLAIRFALHGRRVILGSREPERGRRTALELNAKLEGRRVDSEITGGSNQEAAEQGDIIVVTLPYDGHLATMQSLGGALEGKMVVTATIRWPPALDGKPSAAEELEGALEGRGARVVAAFQTVSAGALAILDEEPADREDVLVFADDRTTRREAVALVEDTGLRGVEAGPLQGARVAEALTGLLLGINKLYGLRSIGIRITRLPSGETRS
jgi:NADPH-dependent F420 reductase